MPFEKERGVWRWPMETKMSLADRRNSTTTPLRVGFLNLIQPFLFVFKQDEKSRTRFYIQNFIYFKNKKYPSQIFFFIKKIKKDVESFREREQ
jgi:hypothetical protein